MYQRLSRLSRRTQEQLIEHFVAGTTARAAAQLVGVHRRAGPVGPRRGPAGAHRARRADRHHHGGRPPRVRHLRGAGRVRAGAGSANAPWPGSRPRGRHGGRTFALSKAQVRLAQAAMARRDTSVSELCRDLGITPVTLYRYVGPKGQLREQGEKVLAL